MGCPDFPAVAVSSLSATDDRGEGRGAASVWRGEWVRSRRTSKIWRVRAEGGVVELGGIEVGGEVEAVPAGAGFGEPVLFEEPVLVATLFPLERLSV